MRLNVSALYLTNVLEKTLLNTLKYLEKTLLINNNYTQLCFYRRHRTLQGTFGR